MKTWHRQFNENSLVYHTYHGFDLTVYPIVRIRNKRIVDNRLFLYVNDPYQKILWDAYDPKTNKLLVTGLYQSWGFKLVADRKDPRPSWF